MAYDPNDPEDQKILEQKVDEAVTGLKAKNNELIGDARKLKDRMKEMEEKFKDIDPESVRKMLDRLANDEEAKLIADGKMDEVVNKRVERMRADYENKLKAAQDKVAQSEDFANRFRERLVDSTLRDAALKAGALPEAADDIVFRGRASGFRVNEDGEVVLLKGNEVVLGKDGKTPLTPSEWVEDIREKATHLWPKASGGNAPGGGGRATKKFSELSEPERVKLYKENPKEYERLRDAEKNNKT